MAKKQASNAYHVAYNKAKYKRIEIVFDRERDAKTIAFLDTKTNRAVWIKEQIEKGMKKGE